MVCHLPVVALHEVGFFRGSQVPGHLTLLGSAPAMSARVPGEYALAHICDVAITTAQKIAIMRRFIDTGRTASALSCFGFGLFLGTLQGWSNAPPPPLINPRGWSADGEVS